MCCADGELEGIVLKVQIVLHLFHVKLCRILVVEEMWGEVPINVYSVWFVVGAALS